MITLRTKCRKTIKYVLVSFVGLPLCARSGFLWRSQARDWKVVEIKFEGLQSWARVHNCRFCLQQALALYRKAVDYESESNLGEGK